MQSDRFDRSDSKKATHPRDPLAANQQVLAEINVRNLFDIRKAAAADRLRNARLEPQELKTWTSFASLARVFPPDVALKLGKAVDGGLDAIARWDEKKFAKNLAAAGVEESVIAKERQRFARFLLLIKRDKRPEDLTGLHVDLGDDHLLLKNDVLELAEKGVQTLADWAYLRSDVKVSAEARRILDGYARLSIFEFDPGTIRNLLSHNIDSAISLARLTDGELQTILNSGGISTGVLGAARTQATAIVDRAIVAVDLRVPDLAFPFGNLWPRACVACPENESVLSKFAYYLYLVEKTEKTFHELEITLFHDFSRLTPADGDEVVPQAVVCHEILRIALGRSLTGDEMFPERRFRTLSVLRKVVPRTPAQIVSFLESLASGAIPADLLPRLKEAYVAPLPTTDEEMLNPQPVFSNAEIDALGFAAETFLVQEIQADPAFAGATAQQLRDEVNRRIAERAQDEMALTRLIQRAAYKKALNKTDRQLFAELFLETDLPLCERTTRLDQAIRTLQAYLTKNGTSTPRYLSFTAWRGESLGQYYPEAAVLLRDDVLLGDTGAWDRGSILRNHAVQHAELKSQLSTVRRAIDESRVDTNSDSSITLAQWNQLSKFKDEPSYAYFELGLKVIDDVLDANDQVYRAAGEIDREEPGLALARLQSAVTMLDAVDGELFDNDLFWANQEPNRKRYSELLKEKPEDRKWTLQLQFFNFAQARKKLFQLNPGNQTVAGLTDFTVLEVGHPDWTASPEFEQGSDYIVRNEAGSGSRVSEFRYDRGYNLTDYTFSCEFRAQSYWQTGQPDRSPKAGIGFRLQDGNPGGYRLAVLASSRVYDGDDGPTSVLVDILALQRVSTGGGVDTLSEREIGTSNYTEIEGSTIRTDHWYALTATASGGQLTGSLRITPEKTITLGPVQNASLDKGAISIFVRGTAEVEFRNLSFRAETPTGAPPFFAKRRADLSPDMRSNLSDEEYWKHLQQRRPMSQQLVTEPLAEPIDGYAKKQLNGVKRNNKNLYLTFPPGSSQVHLNRMDRLLERSLILTYYLRFAVIPVRMAQAYLAMGEYQSASDLLHVLYDEQPDDRRNRTMYPFFDWPWFTDFADPGIDAAAARLRLGEVYLRWAEMFFRQNTEASRYEARRLYERVLRLHGQEDCSCVEQQSRAAQHVYALARQSGASDGFNAARAVLLPDSIVRTGKLMKTKSWDEVRQFIQHEREEYHQTVKSDGTPAKFRLKALELIKNAELTVMGRRSFSAGSILDRNVPDLASPSPRLMSLPRMALCKPVNPLEFAQTSEACLMLSMLRKCVNILGYPDTLIPPLRFEVLLRIAQNFAGLAHAAERDVLQFRQAFEQESFALMQAQANLEQARVEVAIERLNVELAEGEIALAQIQQDQVQAALAHFESLVSEGMTDTERQALAAADGAAQLATASAIFSFASMPAGMIAAGASGSPAGAIGGQGQLIGAMGSAMSAQASALSMRASLERQQQDREFQLQQMQFGFSIALESVALTFGRWQVAQLREELAGLRHEFAQDALAFLSNKLLSAAGWLMLMKVSREQYRRRLLYAIEIAYLAERALAFELQNPALKIIRFDYYDARKDGLLGATQLLTDLAQLEARKLAFRQRKLQLSKTISLAALFPAAMERFRRGSGVFVFSTTPEMFDREFPAHYLRLIQSVRVTVVALVPPTQGIRATLRNTGVSHVVVGPPYATAFETRTIRRNPESVALSAPFQASGLFVLDYKDELLLPFEGSGVVSDWILEMPKAANPFNFDTMADVLVTLEYTALEGPLTYRDLVISRLAANVHVDRAYSFRSEFPDQWYDLHHPDLVDDRARQMVVSFETMQTDFPPNLDQLAIEHVALYFSHGQGASFAAVPVRYLNFLDDGNRDAVDSNAEGIISTRRTSGAGSAPASWTTAMADKNPAGKWELSFNFADSVRDDAIRQRFTSGNIRDFLLVISYRGKPSVWP